MEEEGKLITATDVRKAKAENAKLEYDLWEPLRKAMIEPILNKIKELIDDRKP